jgi:hypothetical protein
MLLPGGLSPFPRTGGALDAGADDTRRLRRCHRSRLDGREPAPLVDGAEYRDLVEAFGFHVRAPTWPLS